MSERKKSIPRAYRSSSMVYQLGPYSTLSKFLHKMVYQLGPYPTLYKSQRAAVF